MKVEMQKTECRELSDIEIDSVTGGSILGDIAQGAKAAAGAVTVEAGHLYNVLKYGEDPMASQH